MGPVHADAWYTTGAAHVVCQDYALFRHGPGGAGLAVVSDGCSGSPDTDVGARLLARCVAAAFDEGRPLSANELVWRAAAAAATVGLPDTALDATLLWAHVHDGTIELSLAGDGVLAARRRSGELEIWVAEHPEGAPHYLSYRLDAARHREYLTTYGDHLVVSHRERSGQWSACSRRGDGHCIRLSASDYDLVLVGSDGLLSFVRPPATDDVHTDGAMAAVAIDAVVEGLARIPQPRGRFVARRGRRFIGRQCPARGWRALDDVAIAAVALDAPDRAGPA